MPLRAATEYPTLSAAPTIRPTKEVSDTYISPGQVNDGGLRQMVQALSSVHHALREYTDDYVQEKAASDEALGRKARLEMREQLDAVGEQKMLAQHSRWWIKGYRAQQGATLGQDIQLEVSKALAAAPGLANSTDPHAIDSIVNPIIQSRLGPETDPDVIVAALPGINQMVANERTAHSARVSENLKQSALDDASTQLSTAITAGIAAADRNQLGFDVQTFVSTFHTMRDRMGALAQVPAEKMNELYKASVITQAERLASSENPADRSRARELLGVLSSPALSEATGGQFKGTAGTALWTQQDRDVAEMRLRSLNRDAENREYTTHQREKEERKEADFTAWISAVAKGAPPQELSAMETTLVNTYGLDAYRAISQTKHEEWSLHPYHNEAKALRMFEDIAAGRDIAPSRFTTDLILNAKDPNDRLSLARLAEGYGGNMQARLAEKRRHDMLYPAKSAGTGRGAKPTKDAREDSAVEAGSSEPTMRQMRQYVTPSYWMQREDDAANGVGHMGQVYQSPITGLWARGEMAKARNEAIRRFPKAVTRGDPAQSKQFDEFMAAQEERVLNLGLGRLKADSRGTRATIRGGHIEQNAPTSSPSTHNPFSEGHR